MSITLSIPPAIVQEVREWAEANGTSLNKYVREGRIRCYGISPRCRFFLRSEIIDLLKRRAAASKSRERTAE